MKRNILIPLLPLAVLQLFSLSTVSAAANDVDALLARMTLEEKIGQLVQYQYWSESKASEDQSLTGIAPDLIDAVTKTGVGSLLGACGVGKFNALQRLAVENTRLGIPLLVGHDIIHGCRTVLPIPLALSCAWDEELWRRGAEMMAVEALSRGCNWTFNPMVDIARDARWGRSAESPGQDPLLAARYAAQMVRGYQGGNPADGRHIAACLKHYVAYGACEGGRDYNAVELSDDTLRNVYLPPFRAGIEAGAFTVMPAFHTLNGVPCTVNRYLLTDILRGEFGFTGFTISDFAAIGECQSGHRVAATLEDIGAKALRAGTDQDMLSWAYRDTLAHAVESGKITTEEIDRAVRRILSVKARMGLFEHPYIQSDILRTIDFDAHRALAREAAAKCCVLLQNRRGVLPLKRDAKIALVGDLADNAIEMFGCWQNWRENPLNASLREGLAADGVTCAFTRAYTVTGALDRASLDGALAAADTVIAAFGEYCGDFVEMNGENTSRAEITLTPSQREAIAAIRASGRKFVAVVFCGRPLAMPELAEAADAVLVAWSPGSSGGWGVADVLTGLAEPYGRLTVDFPHKTGECPLYYNHLPTGRPWQADGRWTTRYIDAPSPGRSLYPFGAGLAYTTFTYTNETATVRKDMVVFSATIANIGERTGHEVVQVYVRDLAASISRPVRELKGFSRVSLTPGESRAVEIVVPVRELGFWHDGKYTVEPGAFAAWIAHDSASGRELGFRID